MCECLCVLTYIVCVCVCVCRRRRKWRQKHICWSTLVLLEHDEVWVQPLQSASHEIRTVNNLRHGDKILDFLCVKSDLKIPPFSTIQNQTQNYHGGRNILFLHCSLASSMLLKTILQNWARAENVNPIKQWPIQCAKWAAAHSQSSQHLTSSHIITFDIFTQDKQSWSSLLTISHNQSPILTNAHDPLHCFWITKDHSECCGWMKTKLTNGCSTKITSKVIWYWTHSQPCRLHQGWMKISNTTYQNTKSNRSTC